MRKPRILIADDDTMVRIGLKTVINWEENGFVLVGEAANGLEAMQLVQEKKPDIVITDIKMPGMDGIELIRQLRQQSTPPEILVLSSYDEFELVKQALKLGARDYLLKLNLNPEELLHSLRAIAAENTAASPLFSGDDEKSRALLRQNFLWDVVSNYYMSGQQLEQSMRELEIHLEGRPVYCMVIKVGEVYRFEEATAEEIQTLRISVVNITEEIVSDVCCGYCFSGRTGEFDVLLTAPSPAPDEAVLRLAKRLRKMLHEYLELSCTVLVGSSMQPAAPASRRHSGGQMQPCRSGFMHRMTVCCCGGRIWSRRGRTATACPVCVQSSAKFWFPARRRSWSECLRGSKPICSGWRSAVPLCVRSRSSCCTSVQEHFERNELPIRTVLTNSCRSYEELLHMETLGEVIAWLDALRQDLSDFLLRESEKGGAKIVGMAQDWIAAHYREAASLQEAARAVSLNPSYFSTLLKKFTGKSYTELLMEYRIERAKELLLLTDAKVYRVGQMVGYEDKFYFSRIFKRVTGMTPVEFKNQRREG